VYALLMQMTPDTNQQQFNYGNNVIMFIHLFIQGLRYQTYHARQYKDYQRLTVDNVANISNRMLTV